MSSNNHNYDHAYHQQGSAQQCSSYRSAPPSNASTQSSRQYHQISSTAPSQPAEYLSNPDPSRVTSNTTYGAALASSWSGSGGNHGTTRDNGSKAAEVLRNLSNTGCAATIPAPSQSGFTATNAAPAHYSSGRSPQMQAQPLQVPHTAYGQVKPRPRSVDTEHAQASASRALSSPVTAAGYPSQRAPLHSPPQPTQQRTNSPSQTQYGQSDAAAASTNTAVAAAGAPPYHADYIHRHFPNADTSSSSHTKPPSNSITPRTSGPIVQPHVSNIPEPHTGSSTTVDPTAVYDPWPEYRRKRAEQEREDEVALKEKERLQVEERKQKEAKERTRQAQLAASQLRPRAKEEVLQQPTSAAVLTTTGVSETSASASDLEAEIRAMMSKMRELNGKDPQLLARIWEEERKAKAPVNVPPTVSTNSVPQSRASPPAQETTPPIANQRKKATPRESFSTSAAKHATPARYQEAPARPTTAIPMRTRGTTIWPPEKKLELAKAAAHYLTTKNPGRPLGSDHILQMLDGNPSYVELCEQFEQIGFNLDRSTFAKSLLLAVPDVNSASRKTALQPLPPAAATKALAPPAVMKHPVAMSVAPSQRYASTIAPPMDRVSYPPFPDKDAMAAPTPTLVTEKGPIKPGLKPPANKAEAARKRNLSDLIDLTQLDDEEDLGPPMKRVNANPMYTYGPAHPHMNDAMDIDMAQIGNFPTAGTPATIDNFPIASTHVPVVNEPTSRTVQVSVPVTELRYATVVESLDKKKALRLNKYNPATIARDVLLACGRHPSERQLNQHLDVLKAHLPQISNESDLNTIKWSLIDPGNPPPGYFKGSVQALTEDANDEDDSDKEDIYKTARREETVRVQALPEATNPFKQKRRGRPPRHSLPNTTTPSSPSRQTNPATMSSSAPRPTAGVGYSAFREYGPDGNPLPKKKGRPVGWRKAIHGSAAAQQRPTTSGHTGKYKSQQPSTLRDVRASKEPILINPRSRSGLNGAPQYQSFQCKWQNCKAVLHNLETLKMHVFKVHKQSNSQRNLECLWDNCGREVTSFDPLSNVSLERHMPHAFGEESAWREHIQQNHLGPLAWEQGDGPASGLSDAYGSEAYLSDAQGRRVTPRITASPADYESIVLSPQHFASTPRGRGRPAKYTQEQDARDTQDRLVSQKRRLGGPGMDRGGATLVNDKRRRGLLEGDGTEEEYVNAEN